MSFSVFRRRVSFDRIEFCVDKCHSGQSQIPQQLSVRLQIACPKMWHVSRQTGTLDWKCTNACHTNKQFDLQQVPQDGKQYHCRKWVIIKTRRNCRGLFETGCNILHFSVFGVLYSLSFGKNILWLLSVSLSHLSAEIVLPSTSGHTNCSFCHIITREQLNGFSLNLTSRYAIWGWSKLVHFNFPQFLIPARWILKVVRLADDHLCCRLYPWSSAMTSSHWFPTARI
jgi:hypothetical protein